MSPRGFFNAFLISVCITAVVSITVIFDQGNATLIDPPQGYIQTNTFAPWIGSTNYMSTTNALGEVAAAGSGAQAQARTNIGIGSWPSTYAAPAPVITVLGSSGRTLVTSTSATGFQLSATCTSHVVYCLSISTTATIGGASSGSVALQTCPTNSTTPSAWTTVTTFTNTQTVTLAVLLQSVQGLTGIVAADVPAGYYVRLLSSGSGTFANSFASGNEKINALGY